MYLTLAILYFQKSVNKALKAEAKRVTRMEQRQERQEKKEKTEKKESAEKTDEPSAASTSKWAKQVTKLIRTNLDVLAFFFFVYCRITSKRTL